MSLEKRNNTNREFKSLQNSFGQWEPGEPSADVWENLEADLAVSAVWDRLDETLEANGSSADKALVDSYENWSPNNSGDGWSKLEEQLSRERVWTRLNTTLSYPITTRIPWMKMAAASILFVFLAFYTDQFTNSNVEKSDAGIFLAEGTDSDSENKERQIASVNENNNNAPVEEVTNSATNKVNTPNANAQKIVVANEPNGLNKPVQNQENGLENRESNSNQNGAQNNTAQNTSNGVKEEPTNVNQDDLADWNELGRKEIASVPGVIEDFTFLPYKPAFRPKFSVLVGGQFAFINEKNRSAFSSSLPSMGIAADVQYHAYVRNLRFTQNLGFSQYAQSNGSYVNGRYTNSNQKLNTIHLMSSIGYTFKGVTISGGITVNRLLNGYEENRTAITNVYNSKKLQIGAAAGVDYHFTPFKNRTALGLGIQYQFVSRLKSENTVFNDIQGVKLQIKYSF